MTQRTLEEIRASLKDYATSELNLTDSVVAEWKILQEIFVYAIWLFEGIMVVFQNDINKTIQEKQPPTLNWWYDIVKNFQENYELEVDENGILRYTEEDEDAKIIAQALLTEKDSSPRFRIKVARWENEDNKTLQALSGDQLQKFKDYIKALHPPGIDYQVYSTAPDLIKYTIEIIYDPAYTDIETKVKDALDEYRKSVNFTETVYREAMLAKVISLDAIKNAYFTTLEAKEDDGSYSTVTHNYTLIAGYFEFDTQTVNATSA